MKKLLAFLLLLMLCACTALAEAPDYAAMTDEELTAAMAAISAEMGRRAKVEKTTADGESLGKIKDIFPDEALAMIVRDKCGKFSIEQTVTQEELDKILYIAPNKSDYGELHDLTGISLLRNLRGLILSNGIYLGTSLPNEICTLTQLETLSIYNVASGFHTIPLASLPEDFDQLQSLRSLTLTSTSITALPDTIGSMKSLTHIDISYTQITELPESIWSLELSELLMRGLPVK